MAEKSLKRRKSSNQPNSQPTNCKWFLFQIDSLKINAGFSVQRDINFPFGLKIHVDVKLIRMSFCHIKENSTFLENLRLPILIKIKTTGDGTVCEGVCNLCFWHPLHLLVSRIHRFYWSVIVSQETLKHVYKSKKFTIRSLSGKREMWLFGSRNCSLSVSDVTVLKKCN